MFNKIILTSAISFFLIAGIASNFSDRFKQPKIIWGPEEIETSVFRGGTRTIAVNFSSNQNIPNANIFITPSIRSLIKFSTISLNVVSGNNSLEFAITIPKDNKKKEFEGTLHIRSGNRTISRPLKIEIEVLNTQNLEQEISDLLFQQFGTTTPLLPADVKFLFASTTPEADLLINDGSNLPYVFKLSSVNFIRNLPIDDSVTNVIPDLMVLTKSKGIRTDDIEDNLSQNNWHRDDPTSPILIVDEAVTFVPGWTLYDSDGNGIVDILVRVFDGNTHIVLRPVDAENISAKIFLVPAGIPTSAVTTLHELTHVFNFRTLCGDNLNWFNSQAEEDFVSPPNLENLYIDIFATTPRGTETLNSSVDRILNLFPNTQNCLERLDLTRPTAVTLNTPTNISTSTVTLSWSQNTDRDFSSYKVFRDTNPNITVNDFLVTTLTSFNTTSFIDSGLAPNTAFFYKVFVFDKAGLSRGSNEVSATTESGRPILLGSNFPVSIAPNPQTHSSVAFDGTNYLVVWTDARTGTENDIFGARVTPEGVVLDPDGFPISVAPDHQQLPSVIFDGSKYFVVWEDYRSGNGSADIFGTFVSTSGEVSDSNGFVISDQANSQFTPAVAFDGTNYIVVWDDRRLSPNFSQTFGSRLDTNGNVLDIGGFSLSSPAFVERNPAIAFDGNNYLVIYNHSTGVFGTRVSPQAQILDPGSFALSSSTLQHFLSALAFDGNNYLAVWVAQSGSSFDIRGTRITPLGNVLDPQSFLVSASAHADPLFPPAIAFGKNSYLVVWGDNRNEFNIFGALVSPTNLITNPDIQISHSFTGIPVQRVPAVGPSASPPMVMPIGSKFLVVWNDLRNNFEFFATNFDIFGQFVSE